MAEKVYLKPKDKKGKPVLVRDPLTGKKMPEDGCWVDLTNHTRKSHFITLLRRGDVVKAKPPTASKQAAIKAKEASE